MLRSKDHIKFKVGAKLPILILTSLSAVVFNLTPEINWQTKTIKINNQVFAQSDAELQKYVQAAKQIENLRKSTFSQIEAKVGKDKANQLTCYQASSLNQLPEDARSLAQNYCNQSEEIVKQNGLTINDFNRITQQRKNSKHDFSLN